MSSECVFSAGDRHASKEKVVGVPVSFSCDSGRGQKGRAVGGGSIHKLPRALPCRKVVLSPLGARKSTAGSVAPDTYSTCSGGRWWAWLPRGGRGGKTGCTPHVLPQRSVVRVRVMWLRCACDFAGLTCWDNPGVVGRGRCVCPPAGGPASGFG